MPISMGLMMEPSDMKDKILALHFSMEQRSCLPSCKLICIGSRNLYLIFRTDFIWAKAMGYSGAQIPDADGVSVGKQKFSIQTLFYSFILEGTSAKPTQEYKYLDGRCRHYKLIGKVDIEI